MATLAVDFIVVGAGSAGCVVASRLSESGSHRVLLLEAGSGEHPLGRIPILFARLIDHPRFDWRYRSQPEPGTGGRAIPVPRGRMLGGSSGLNGMVYVRGQALDYDGWAQLGNRGWSFDDLLPVFRRMESYSGGEEDWRGRDGPLAICEADESGPLYDALFAAGAAVGLPRNPDYNGAQQEGVCVTQATIQHGRRVSAADSYLAPARHRPNLMVETGATVDHLVFDGRRCVGVRYRQGGTVREAHASGEVVLAAGSINSPQVLELSGVGRPDVLAAHGVAVRRPLPGVGENLRDHAAPRMMWSIQRRGVTYNDRARGLGMAWQALRYALRRDGFLAMPAAPMMAFLRTRAGLETPDFQLVFIPFLADRTALRKRRLAREAGMVIVGCQLRPESTGSVHVQSPDPAAAPAIRLNLLATAFDRETTIAGIRQARRLMAAAPLDSFRGPELQPGPGVQSDADLLGWLRETVETMYHPVGTCRMGQDEGAVVDHELRVRGLSGLRVADASIMPTLVSGNTHAASMMIGEKAAEMILAARR